MGITIALSSAFRTVFERCRRLINRRQDGSPREWCLRVERMRKCLTAEQVVREFGEPAHKVPMGEMMVWHYPLGIDGGFFYSIHAVTEHDRVSQVYLHFVPSS
jgi:hypothetical protein